MHHQIINKTNFKIMKLKNILFLILFTAFVVLTISIIQANIYLLGFAEIILIPTLIGLFITNLKNS